MSDRLESITQRLKSNGYRLTPQRMAIIKTVMDSHDHLTAEQIYQQVVADFPMISLATVYKTLHMLEELGEVTELSVDGRSLYDSDTVPHPHLICIKCHAIIDLPPEAMVQIPQEAIDGTGFQVLWYEMEGYGLCSQCASSAGEHRPRRHVSV